MSKRDEAVTLLTHYLAMGKRSAGEFSADNRAEIGSIVDLIIAAAREQIAPAPAAGPGRFTVEGFAAIRNARDDARAATCNACGAVLTREGTLDFCTNLKCHTFGIPQ